MKFLILGILNSAIVFGASDVQVMIAEELLADHKYSQAIEKCSKVLSEDSGNLKCKEITKNANSAMARIESKKKAEEENAREKAKKDKIIAEEKRKKEIEEEKSKEENYHKLLNSPEYNTKKVCACKNASIYLNDKLNEQKRIGAMSGVVDKKLLYQISSQILMIEKAEGYYLKKLNNKITACNQSAPNETFFGKCIDDTPGNVFN